jgi:hypothetical protein
VPPGLLAAPPRRSAFGAELPAVLRFNRISVPIGREHCWSCGLREYPRSLSLPIRRSDCPGLLTGASWSGRVTEACGPLSILRPPAPARMTNSQAPRGSGLSAGSSRARIVDGRIEGGYTSTFEPICPGYDDHPYWITPKSRRSFNGSAGLARERRA